MDQSELSVLLERWNSGSAEAREDVFERCYAELRQVARHMFARERQDFSMCPSEIVSETFVRLAGGSHVEWQNSRHFIAVFARAMRRTVIDRYRMRGAQKRPPKSQGCELPEEVMPKQQIDIDQILSVSLALEEFEAVDSRRAEIVSLHFFAGLTFAEIGEMAGKSEGAVKKDWYIARLWLLKYMRGKGDGTLP